MVSKELEQRVPFKEIETKVASHSVNIVFLAATIYGFCLDYELTPEESASMVLTNFRYYIETGNLGNDYNGN